MKIYQPIITMCACVSIISFGVVMIRMIIHPKNNQAFPFTETEAGDDAQSEPASVSFESSIGYLPPEAIEWIKTLTYLKSEFGDEYETIMAAAARNDCDGDNLLILFAIRKQENGGPGNEFGIKCSKHINTDLDGQAACASVTIMNKRKFWGQEDEDLFETKGFIFFLGYQYTADDKEDWIRNVTYWFGKFKALENER